MTSLHPRTLAELNHAKSHKEEVLGRVLAEKRLMEEQEGRLRCELQTIENRLYSLMNKRGEA